MTFDAHFRTWMSYSSQKSCVKIWFGLVEIGGMLIVRGWRAGGQKPLSRGLHVTCNTHFRKWPSYFSQKSCVKIWFGLVEPFKSYRGEFYVPALALQGRDSCTRQKGRKDSDGRVQDVGLRIPECLKADQSRMNLIALADRLHKTIEEVEQISVTEFHEWLAYFQIMSEQADGDSRR